ncbi:MAG: hypothetical protein FD175_2651 [Beijerinckiaceae bacterium]|nr:MAG: hypothetical protein FD175_2651 [Beijerinckiaceae bacterium]
MSTALWSILFAGLLPYFTVIIAKRSGGGYNNRRPREWAAGLIADMETGASPKVLWLSIAILAARLGYTAAYFWDRQGLRSLMWFIALLGVIGLFVLAALGK